MSNFTEIFKVFYKRLAILTATISSTKLPISSMTPSEGCSECTHIWGWSAVLQHAHSLLYPTEVGSLAKISDVCFQTLPVCSCCCNYIIFNDL